VDQGKTAKCFRSENNCDTRKYSKRRIIAGSDNQRTIHITSWAPFPHNHQIKVSPVVYKYEFPVEFTTLMQNRCIFSMAMGSNLASDSILSRTFQFPRNKQHSTCTSERLTSVSTSFRNNVDSKCL
jgi:hypothetical protein